MEEKMILTKEWDKTFPQSDKVEHSKVTFRNRYGITLAADLYKPKHAEGKPLWRGEGAGCWPVRPDNGGARFLDDRL